jgi:hypothetical protein
MNEPRNSHERWSEELPAYLLGVLSGGKAVECGRHLERCASCQAEARRLAPAVEQLARSAISRQPPAGIRKQVLAHVREDARGETPVARRSVQGGQTLKRGHVPRSLIGFRLAAGMAAVLLVLVAIGGYVIGSGGSGSGPTTTTVVAGHAPGVTATVIRRGDQATLRLANVRPLPPRRVLEAWVGRGRTVEPVKALFAPDRDGRAQTTIEDIGGADVVMVTAEPAGGSRSPTSTPIVSVPLSPG